MGLRPWQCRLKELFEFAQGLGAHDSSLRDLGPAAGRNVQHPERHFENPRSLGVFQAAVRYRPAAFYESGMHPYFPAMPWMPGIADFTEISNMGVVLLSCITAIERMRGWKGECRNLLREERYRQLVSVRTGGGGTAGACTKLRWPLDPANSPCTG
jgi:hypothetical protein